MLKNAVSALFPLAAARAARPVSPQARRRGWRRGYLWLAALPAFFPAQQPAQAQTAQFVPPVSATVNVGIGATAVAVNPAGTYAYVANFGGGVYVIDLATNTVTAAVVVGTGPTAVAVNSTGTYAYVANEESNTVSVIDLASNTVTATVDVGTDPNGVAVNPVEPYAYVANEGGGVSVIDLATNTVTATIKVGSAPYAVAVNSTGTYAYVANEESNTVSVIDLANNTVSATVDVGTDPVAVAVNPAGTYAYVANSGSDTVSVIDLATDAVSTVDVGSEPYAVAVNPAEPYAYVANEESNTVSVIDLATNTVTATIKVGSAPDGVAVNPAGTYAYVANYESDAVSVIDLAAWNFGSEAVGSTTASASLTFSFTAAGAIEAPAVLTQGATGLDFTDAKTGACTTNGTSYSYAEGDTCTVNVTFAPQHAGARYGAVELLNSSGAVIATAYVYGAGNGPQVVFNPAGTTATLGSGLNYPYGVAVDGSGNVYIADTINNRVVKVPWTGSGFGTQTAVGSDLSDPYGVAVDGSGNVYIVDTINKRVVKAPPTDLTCSTASDCTTVVSDFSYPYGVAVDGSGNVYIADYKASSVVKVPWTGSGYGTQTTVGSGLSEPSGVAVDGSGNVYIADTYSDRVVEEPWTGSGYGTQTALVSGLSEPYGVAVDGSGNLYIGDTNAGTVVKLPWTGSGYGAQATLVSGLSLPSGVAVDGSGNVYIANTAASSALKEDYADAPTLSFASTDVGSTSSPQTVTVENIGNEPLTIEAAPSITNGSANFTLDTTCSTANPLAEGASCALEVDFAPTETGSPLSGTATLTDTNLNADTSPYATQTINLSGPAYQITLSPSTLPAATAGTNYALTFTASGGTAPYTYSVSTGTLPSSLSLSTSGTLAGTLTEAGSFTFTIQATDSNDFTGTQNYTLTVSAGAPAVLSASAGTPQTAYVNLAFATALTATVTDQYGNGVNGITVSFTAPGTGASATLSASSCVTGTSGSCAVTATANGATGSYTVTAAVSGLTSVSFALTNSAPPAFVVNTTNDDASGVASDCTGTPEGTCTLRDALAAASAAGTGTITFAASAFPATNGATITLGSAGTLTIPSNTTIYGATTGGGATLANLVTVSGNNASTVFTVASGVTAAAISNLNVVDGNGSNGGGIDNSGMLTVADSTISGNSVSNGLVGAGGGIYNNGTLAITGSAISGNSVSNGLVGAGGGLAIEAGTVTVTGSTVSGNSSSGGATGSNGGGLFIEGGTVTVTGSTFSGNSATGSGGGIYFISGTVTLANSIVAGNSAGAYADIYGSYTNNGGNLAGTSSSSKSTITPNLAPLANYGGPTQTMIPLPGSSAICAGAAANIPSGVTTDQRGEPNTNTSYPGYSSSAPCVDAGAVQTSYGIAFTAQPSNVEAGATMSPAPAVTLDESGAPFVIPASVTTPPALGAITLALTNQPTGVTLSGASASPATATGVATYSALSVSAPDSDDTLTATLALNPAATPAPSISAVSGAFSVGQNSQTISFTPPTSSVTYGVSPITLTATGGASGNAVTFSVVSGPGAISGSTLTVTGAGAIVIAANQAGNTDYAAATQVTTSIVVGQAALTITANNATKVYGTANPAFTGTVTGAVNGDSFTESFSSAATASSAVGAYKIVPSVAGADLGDYTQTVTDGTLTVTQAGSITTLKISSASITPGQSVTLTATVADASAGSTGTPTGAVNFYDNGALLNTTPAALSAGVATYSTASLTPGATNVITATYSGDANFLSSGSSASGASSTVAPLDFTMTLTGPSNLTVVPGQSIAYQVKIAPDYGLYAGTVSFAVSGLPPGATATFSPATIAASGGAQTVTVTIQTAPATALLHRERPTPAGRRLAPFALGLLMLFGAGALRRRGKIVRGLLSVLLLVGAGLAVTTLSGCGGHPGFFAQNPQSYTVTVTATSGGLQQSAAVTLDVQ